MSYEVEAIKKQRTNNDGTVSFLVKWVGYARSTWEPKKNLVGAKQILANFLAQEASEAVEEEEEEVEEVEDDLESEASFDEEEAYEVEKIISHRLSPTTRKHLYRIKWLGFNEYAEMDEEQLAGCQGMLDVYKKKHKIGSPVATMSPRKMNYSKEGKQKKESSVTRKSTRKSGSATVADTPSTSRKRQEDSPIEKTPPRSTRRSPSKRKAATPADKEVVELPATPDNESPSRRRMSEVDCEPQPSSPIRGSRRQNIEVTGAPPAKRAAPPEQDDSSQEDADSDVIDVSDETDNEEKTEPTEDENLYAVEYIIGHSTKKGVIYYHVQWEGGDKTWEPEENLKPAADMLAAYRSRNKLDKTEQKKTPAKSKATPEQKAETTGSQVKEVTAISKMGRTLLADVVFTNGDTEKMDLDTLRDMDGLSAYKAMKKHLLSLL